MPQQNVIYYAVYKQHINNRFETKTLRHIGSL